MTHSQLCERLLTDEGARCLEMHSQVYRTGEDATEYLELQSRLALHTLSIDTVLLVHPATAARLLAKMMQTGMIPCRASWRVYNFGCAWRDASGHEQ